MKLSIAWVLARIKPQKVTVLEEQLVYVFMLCKCVVWDTSEGGARGVILIGRCGLCIAILPIIILAISFHKSLPHSEKAEKWIPLINTINYYQMCI